MLHATSSNKVLDTNYKRVELYNQRVMNLDIHIVANSFTLLLRSDLQTIQHITVRDILDDNIFYRVTFNN